MTQLKKIVRGNPETALRNRWLIIAAVTLALAVVAIFTLGRSLFVPRMMLRTAGLSMQTGVRPDDMASPRTSSDVP